MRLEDHLTDDGLESLFEAAEENRRAKAKEAAERRRAGTKYGTGIGNVLDGDEDA